MPEKPVINKKVILIGQASSGKTSLAHRFVRGDFKTSYSATVGVDFFPKNYFFDKYTLKLGLWDPAGSERYENVVRSYYRNSHVAIICFDLTNPSFFNRAMLWAREVKAAEPACLLYLCGTKLDLVEGSKRTIQQSEVQNLANELDAKVYETSSLTGHHIKELFDDIVKVFSSEKFEPLIVESVKLNEKKKSHCWC